MSATLPVLIVGAGPTGLAAANLLGRWGVAYRIIDRSDGPTEQSRALVVHARTLELFRSLGLAERAVAEGRQGMGGRIFSGGRQLAELRLDSVHHLETPYPFVLVLEQSRTERILLDALAESGGRVEYGRELSGLVPESGGVVAVVRDGQKEERIRCRHLIGADGARSAVRRLLEIPFPGGTYEQSFVLADAVARGEIHTDGLSIFLAPVGPTVLLPMAGDRFRVIAVLPASPADSADETAPPDLAAIESLLRQRSGRDIRLSDARWISTYRIHHRRVERFRSAACYLAGDAAHVHSPAGGQGMNTGIQDAWNLAWKLALVERGVGRPELLDSYHAERYPVAGQLLRFTDRMFSAALSRNSFVQASRSLLVPLALRLVRRLEPLRRSVVYRLSQLGIAYRNSPIVAEHRGPGPLHSLSRFAGVRQLSRLRLPVFPGARRVRAGDRAPAGAVESAGGQASDLLDLIPADGFAVLLIGPRRARRWPDSFCSISADLRPFGNLMRVYALWTGATAAPPLPPEVRARPILASAAVSRRYAARTAGLYLIRPDGYVAFRSIPADAPAFARYLDTIFLPGQAVR